MDTIQLKHLLDIPSLGNEGISEILRLSDDKITPSPGYVCFMFFENSTRTRLSFELAAKMLGKQTLIPNLAQSSIQKGETVLDTIETVAAMGVDQIILRCTDDDLPAQAASLVGHQCTIINAGNGTSQHPSQALTDLYILNQHCQGDWSSLSVGFIGHISHSRVANSLIDGLRLLGVKEIRSIAPACWQNDTLDAQQQFTDLAQGLAGLDAVVCLRPQNERLPDQESKQLHDQLSSYRLDEQHLTLMQPNAIVLHPGPALRGQEITQAVLSSPQCKMLDQVSASINVRKAILTFFS